MTRVLLTGGSGFIAAHILDLLVQHGHSVVTTVRSQEKADKIKEAYPKVPREKLECAIVEDIAKENAFDGVVKSDPPFEAVIHTASPFHYDVSDVKRDFLDPAIIGTTGILKAVHKHAPSVKRIVITSSFAAVLDASKGTWPGHVYTEKDWNPVTLEDVTKDPGHGYRASKTFAEKAAWEFVEKEKPNFSISTINPPLVFGPVIHYLNSLSAVNTSNQQIASILEGKWKEKTPSTNMVVWVDVRDVAEAHVKAMEIAEAAGKRFLVSPGHFSYRQVADIVRENFPDLRSLLAPKDAPGGDFPEGGMYDVDSSRTKEVLHIKFRTLKECIVDLIKSLQAVHQKASGGK
ncbi:MAG: methylglyoxal reductase (NADPH-dependent) gre2 [Phylliscum demangeonii]|nr:MAG: methylglyoxal reductase (NADPH-dependent) gre2 [Phylliscum demangeonii]